MRDNRMKDALENIARRGIPENTNLWPNISARLERKSFMLTLRSRPLVAIILALLILLVLSGVAYAIGHSLGYIPGIGLIDQSAPMRVLAEPVTLTRDGFTVKVEEAILSADKTVIKLRIDGIAIASTSQDIAQCKDGSITLPDGSSLKVITGNGMDFWGSGFEARLTFGPIPTGVTEATFIPPCIQEYLPGAKLEDWKLPLRFIPASSEMTVMPVIEVTPSPQAASENPLTLEKIIETDSGYILAGTFSSVGLPPNEKAVQFGQPPTITDASGQNVPFDFANYKLDLPAEKIQEGVFPWAFEIKGKQFNWPLTITADLVTAEYQNIQTKFEFDTEAKPPDDHVQELDASGKTVDYPIWNVDIDLGELAGYPVRVVRIIRRADGYEFYFKSSAIFNGIYLQIEDSTQGLTGMDGPGDFSSNVKFTGPIPSGKLIVLVTHPIVAISGNWQLQWKPDRVPTLPTPTAVSASANQACLTIDSWKAALANPAPIPADISGRIIVSEYYTLSQYNNLLANSSGPSVYVANLDGSNMKNIGSGIYDISPSPDGSQVVYSREDGLYIENIATGETHQIPNTISNDRSPYWSPDGTRIAFARFGEQNDQQDLYIIHPDGTDIRRVFVIDGAEFEMLRGWFPDNSALLYILLNRQKGTSIEKLDLASGTSSELFTALGNISLSPNGNEITFGNEIAIRDGIATYGLYVSSLNGSDRRLIGLTTSSNHWNISSPVWSPDGKWLAVNITDLDKTQAEITEALVNPQTCHLNFAQNKGQVVASETGLPGLLNCFSKFVRLVQDNQIYGSFFIELNFSRNMESVSNQAQQSKVRNG